MEVVLYNSTVCRLCGEENDNGTFLYSTEENNQNISDLVNAYLPVKVSDDGHLPRTICPGCTIQLEAAVEFINLIVIGQKTIRALYQREKEYKKNLSKAGNETSETIVVEVDPQRVNGSYQEDHPMSLKVAGLDKPKRKRGRPPKKVKSQDELELEAAAIEQEEKIKLREEKPTGKRRRKTPERFRSVVQGKELDQIFKEEGMTDGEESEDQLKPKISSSPKEQTPKIPEVIGHTVSGELVVVVKGKGRGRPKGRTKQTHETCAICGKDFSNSGRYMAHIAQHGPVFYQCITCAEIFSMRLDLNNHQQETGHEGLDVLPCTDEENSTEPRDHEPPPPSQPPDALPEPPSDKVAVAGSLPDLNPRPDEEVLDIQYVVQEQAADDEDNKQDVKPEIKVELEEPPKKHKLQCPYCDKKYSTKQAKSMHIKAAHKGERPYKCNECGVSFAYPRALTLHTLAHRRRSTLKGFACDLCGKVLNHPSSVAYHKEAEHANQKYVCGKCGKHFKHKQLLQRHQLVHSQNRPFQCKICNARFKTKANLINHLMLHTGIKKFSCEECKQRFAHKTSLTLHMRWHRGQKPYACKVCNKAFTQKGNLSEHMRIHTGEKPFQCALCPRKFTTSSQHRLHLRRHEPKANRINQALPRVPPNVLTTSAGIHNEDSVIRFAINSNDVPHIEDTIVLTTVDSTSVNAEQLPTGGYKCEDCGRVVATRWALAKHRRLHTGEKPYHCNLCERTFADSSNLNKHKKQVHKHSLLAVQPLPKLVPLSTGPQPPPLPMRPSTGPPPPPLAIPLTVPTSAVEGLQPYVVQTEDDDERVIYVTYDVDTQPIVQRGDSAQEVCIESPSDCELYSGESLLLPTKPLDQPEHMSVTDEEGNPLHFTMQDGTRLAITSLDGHTLQVVTQDGQTIPVEINGLSQDEDESAIEDSVELEMDDNNDPDSPATHYYTVV